jgi:hypothetical protein
MSRWFAAKGLGEERLAEWEKRYEEHPGYKYDHACISELRGFRCKLQYGPFNQYNWRGNPKPCRLPYSDHTSLWKDRETGELVYVTQPYLAGEEWGEIAEMEEFCKEYGLKMKIDPSLSWHNPPSSTLIMVTRDPDTSVPFG